MDITYLFATFKQHQQAIFSLMEDLENPEVVLF